MKKFITCLAVAFAAFGCSKEGVFFWEKPDSSGEELSHDMIVLGEQLQDPYSVVNMSKALQSVVPAGAGRTTIDPTDYYVRFLPKDEEQMNSLLSAGLELIDHPLDYRILKDGDWYHDPSVPEGQITWQYAVVPLGFEFPKGIRYERLDECFIAEHNPSTKADGIDWDAVEMEAYRLTGNMDLYTKAGSETESARPSGRIAIMDPGFDEEPVGVKGVKVCCNAFVKFSTCYTDEEGYYKMSRTFNTAVRYRLVFQNVKGFSQGMNLILIPASTSGLGKHEPSGLNVLIDAGSERKLLTRCAVNNAGYDYMEAVAEFPESLPAPPKDFRIWNLQIWNGELPLMMHHGALIETYEPLVQALGNYTPIVKLLPPDVVLGVKGAETYSDIYAHAMHAFAHGGHFSLAGKEWWAHYAQFALKSLVSSASHDNYGSRDDDDYPYCEIAENYAFYLQSALYRRHYKESSALFGTEYWFAPHLLMFLDERGLGIDKLPPLFTSDVVDMEVLQAKMLSYYPAFKGVINEAFTRYGN